MASENLCLTDTVVGQEAIGCFHGCPILTSPGHTGSEPLFKALHQGTEPPLQTWIGKTRIHQFVLDSLWLLLFAGTNRLSQSGHATTSSFRTLVAEVPILVRNSISYLTCG